MRIEARRVANTDLTAKRDSKDEGLQTEPEAQPIHVSRPSVSQHTERPSLPNRNDSEVNLESPEIQRPK